MPNELQSLDQLFQNKLFRIPDYQRGYVWEQEDKELLLDSIFKNIDIGKFVFIRLSDSEWMERNFGYEIRKPRIKATHSRIGEQGNS